MDDMREILQAQTAEPTIWVMTLLVAAVAILAVYLVPRTSRARQRDGDNSIFICYRPADTADVCGRLYDALAADFGRDRVFRDIDPVPLGDGCSGHLSQQLGRCRAAIVLIGPDWTGAGADRERPIDQETDRVRLELEHLLARDIPVIPVYVRGARFPPPSSLPPSLRPLAFRNGAPLRPDPDFYGDAARLRRALLNLKVMRPG